MKSAYANFCSLPDFSKYVLKMIIFFQCGSMERLKIAIDNCVQIDHFQNILLGILFVQFFFACKQNFGGEFELWVDNFS